MDYAEILPRVGMFIIPFLFALCVHEYAHGMVAHFLGDNTAKIMGRLTLNPVPHIDVIGTLVLPILAITTGGPFFGWAKPVPVNDQNLKNPKTGMALVASAGPLSNILMAFIGTMMFALTIKFFETAPYAKAVVEFSKTFIMINLSLAFFNLIPLHPLDGGKIFAIFFPDSVNQWLEKYQMVFSIILLALFMSGGANFLFTPVIRTAQFLLSTSLQLVGVPL